MAGSNWDEVEIDMDGKLVASKFTTPSGITAEVYKESILVYDGKKLMRNPLDFDWSPDGSAFGGRESVGLDEMRYKDINMISKRFGNNNRIAAIAWYWPDNKPVCKPVYRALLGVYAWGEEDEWIGITKEDQGVLQYVYSLWRKCAKYYGIDLPEIMPAYWN
jgi:hypothetical protein